MFQLSSSASSTPAPPEEWYRLVCRILSAIRIFADPADAAPASFTAALVSIEERLAEHYTAADLDQTAGRITELIESTGRAAEDSLRAHRAEFHAIIGLLLNALAELAPQSADALGRFGQNLEHTAAGASLAELRHRLTDLLCHIDTTPAAPVSHHAIPRADATSLLEHAVRATGLWFAVFPVDRYTSYLSRFGPPVAHDIVRALEIRLRSRLQSADELIAWNDATVLAILPRAADAEEVRTELSHLVNPKLEYAAAFSGGQAVLSIGSTFTLFPSTAYRTVEALSQYLDSIAPAPPATTLG